MFWIVAALMVVLAAVLLGAPLLRTSTFATDHSVASTSGRSKNLVAAALIIVGLPTICVPAYFALGNPGAFAATRAIAPVRNAPPMATAATAMSSAGLVRLAAKLEETLKRTPDDAVRWHMLGSVYAASNRATLAAEAYARAAALSPHDPKLLVEYAEAQAQLNGGNLHGKPAEILQSALAADPHHQRALALSGSAAFNDGDYQGAMSYWQRLLETLAPDSDIARMVTGRVNEAREKIRTAANRPVNVSGKR